ncbi:MAG TPA: outer membrane beta-barrel protein [Pyrinomonadaceae bacterium]|nr:outer membrane beta-barrel protein [Pyrinomonadaceae bacterium]
MRNNTKYIASAFLTLAFAIIGAGTAMAQSDEWTGFYVGGHAGVTVSRTGVNTSTVYTEDGYFNDTSVTSINANGIQKIKGNGFNGGGQAGYNKQFGRFVVGAEVDFGSNRVDEGVESGAEYPCCSGTGYTITQQVKTNWLLTARPRVGVTAAKGKALIYATGGLAVTDVNYAAVFTDTFADAFESAEFKKTRAGYAAGGGIEVKVAKRWSVKGEYLYTNFGRVSATSNNLTTFDLGGKELVGIGGTETWPTSVFTHSTKVKSHNVRFGVNYRF